MLPRVLHLKEVALLLYRGNRTRGALVGSQATGGPHSRHTLSRLPSLTAPAHPPHPFLSLVVGRAYREIPPHADFLPFIGLPLVRAQLFRIDKSSRGKED